MALRQMIKKWLVTFEVQKLNVVNKYWIQFSTYIYKYVGHFLMTRICTYYKNLKMSSAFQIHENIYSSLLYDNNFEVSESQ